jgi:hypothetical protein
MKLINSSRVPQSARGEQEMSRRQRLPCHPGKSFPAVDERKTTMTINTLTTVTAMALIAAGATFAAMNSQARPTFEVAQGGDRYQVAQGGGRYQVADGGDRYQVAQGGDRYQVADGGDRYQVAQGGDRYQIAQSERYDQALGQA